MVRVGGSTMTKVEQAETTLYTNLIDGFSGVVFVGIGKEVSSEIVLVVYIDKDACVNGNSNDVPVIPSDWYGFRVVVNDLTSLICAE